MRSRKPLPVVVRACAKLNLDLTVLGVRADGFHDLRTVFQSIALHDRIECEPREGPFAIECSTVGVPLDESNLIWKAADALWRSLGRRGPVQDVLVRLEKRIPTQAGLGGGSADAAATLAALARVWQMAASPEDLADVAGTLGADVPFFLSGGTALGLGRGDEIDPLDDWPRHWVVLLVPGFGVSSREAFGWYDAWRDGGGSPPERRPDMVPGPWPPGTVRMMNDLEGPLAVRYPEIEQMKAALRGAGAFASAMSGSGSTVFGLFRARREAQAAVDALSGSDWTVILTESLTRSEYARQCRPVTRRRRGAATGVDGNSSVAATGENQFRSYATPVRRQGSRR
ncbi:MAG: 4-(cytidine 5'-diphospho)-2-C-methyl-D-erythritol kinase [Acidobacteria bacterium]|nr:4-(cytidine 5'-diphospho)-2-C-methyl-D-erythritol kinase [Acidobacteriota bacterium]